MSVPEQMPIVEYTANGATTRFPITFDLHDVGYLNVFINKELAQIGSYTVENFEAVIFGTAPKDGDEITLIRDTQLDRETNYQTYDNSFRPTAVNYDFDKIWHVLQEQNLIDGKILARLKAEIEWRRTHDANFDELSKMRDAQIFSGLKQYLDTILAMTNPNIFDGITAGIVFALDKKSVQTHIELIYEQLSENRLLIINEKDRAIASESDLQSQIHSIAGGASRGYKTYAAMQADKDNILADSIVKVTNDPDNTKNGDYQYDGSTFTKSIYDPLTQMKNLVGSSTPNVFINTKITLNFIENTLTGGGGIVSYGTLFVDNIPENQSLALEFSEGFPFGLRKICIHKTTGLFRVFNSSEFVSENYVLLGYLFEKKWYSIASGKKPTIIANALDDYEGNITELEYENDAEIVAGSLSINKTSKTIIGTCTVYAPKYRAYTEVNVTFAGELTAIVFDTNSKSVKALVDTDVLAPSYLVLAKVEGNNIFTTSVNSAFAQVGDDKYSVYGKVDQKVLSSEPTFMSTELKLKIDFSLGQISVEQNGFIFCNATFQAIDTSKNIEFSATNPTYVRYLAYNIQSQKFTLLQNRQVNLGNQEVLLGYVYDYKFYGFGDFKSKVTIINSNGNVVDNPDQDSFDELKQRALIPNKLFFINDRSLPLYKDSIFSNPKVGLEKVRTWIDTNSTDTLKRYISVQQQTILNPSDLSNTAQFVYAHASVANKRYWKNVAVNKSAQSKLSRSFKMLCFGDSLTQVGTPWTLKNKLESLGATVTPVGTFWSTETPNELPSEGRGYWNYREFIGKDNNSSGTPHTRSEGGKTRTTKFETPFLKLATTQDKTDHPTWCFRFTGAQKELSYSDDPNKAGNFYIFDFDWYLTQHSVANPDFITIGLSTNDINLDRDVYSRAEVMQFMQLGLEIMVKQIHKVLPNVPIGIIPCPAWSATENGYATFAADTANWVELCIKKVAELKATHSNLEVIPVYMHMNRDMGYPLTAGSALTSDSDVYVSVVSDWVHYDQIGRDQYAEVVAAWLANSI